MKKLSYVAENLKRKMRQSLKKTKNVGFSKTAVSKCVSLKTNETTPEIIQRNYNCYRINYDGRGLILIRDHQNKDLPPTVNLREYLIFGKKQEIIDQVSL